MTTEIDLLPMPKGEAVGMYKAWSYDQMRDYARANVLHHTATLQAEIERLRAEMAVERNLKADAIHACALANIRAERLADALAELITWFPSAQTYRRMGFDPTAPMLVLKEAKDALWDWRTER